MLGLEGGLREGTQKGIRITLNRIVLSLPALYHQMIVGVISAL
jgi:hypothetical protein